MIGYTGLILVMCRNCGSNKEKQQNQCGNKGNSLFKMNLFYECMHRCELQIIHIFMNMGIPKQYSYKFSKINNFTSVIFFFDILIKYPNNCSLRGKKHLF